MAPSSARLDAVLVTGVVAAGVGSGARLDVAALGAGGIIVGDTTGDPRAADGAVDRLLTGGGGVLGDAAGTPMAADGGALHAHSASATSRPESIRLGTMNQPFT